MESKQILILAFVTLLIGIVLIGSLATQGLLVTEKKQVVDEVVDISPARVSVGPYSELILSAYNVANTLITTPSIISKVFHYNRTYLTFDGTSDMVSGVSSYNNLDSNHSYSVWFNSTLAGEGVIFGVATEFEGLLLSGAELTYSIINDSDTQFNTTGYNLNDSVWHHVIITGRTNTQTGYGFYETMMFVDAIMVNTTNATGVAKSSGGIVNISSLTNSFDGYIDEFRIYNDTLNATEVTEIYNSGRAANDSLVSANLTLWWPFNENSGTTAHDLGLLAHNGTISGATYGNDGIEVNLTNSVDYDVSSGIYTISNTNLAWDEQNISYTVTTDINESYLFTVANSPDGWKKADCILSRFVAGNSSEDYTDTTDYIIDLEDGTLLFRNTTVVREGGDSAYLDYKYCGNDYLNSSWGRTVINLLAAFFALAILFIAIGYFFKVAKENDIV